MKQLLLGLLLFQLTAPVLAGVDVLSIRIWHSPLRTRLVFDLTGPVEYSVFALADPQRIVIDLKDTVSSAVSPGDQTLGPWLLALRSGNPNNGVFRYVLDLKAQLHHDSFLLPPGAVYGHRLVVDVKPVDSSLRGNDNLVDSPTEKDYVVVIDPGHGGDDPGALGRRGTREKKVVLAIAERLQWILNLRPGVAAQLTRKGNYYVSLRNRIRIAAEHQADVFISVHADSARRRSAHGASVYILSSKGASSEIGRELAKRENASDLIGGVKLGRQEHSVRETMLDMEVDWKIKESKEFARNLLYELGKVGVLHTKQVQQAGFVVLKAIEIPAVLVEVGFISNIKEERALQTALHRERIAGSMFRAIVRYCTEKSQCRANQDSKGIYVVRKAESLSLLAARFGTTISAIKRANKLKIDTLLIGQKLVIPEL
ncbi:MAG TPA: AMIN domain-containing protein [Gammaproteobacteria bacterium]|nr:AMIN domain-containing protein [Gammaproteobacteria bacterium]HIM05760.1 AMIN domain-containing protein [Gammaproteobacteria bacterium]